MMIDEQNIETLLKDQGQILDEIIEDQVTMRNDIVALQQMVVEPLKYAVEQAGLNWEEISERQFNCVPRINKNEENIEELFEKLIYLEHKNWNWRTPYMKALQSILEGLRDHPEAIALINSTFEDVSTALDNIEEKNPDLNNDGVVSTAERFIYDLAQKAMKKEKWWFVITHAVMFIGGLGAGLYLGSVL